MSDVTEPIITEEVVTPFIPEIGRQPKEIFAKPAEVAPELTTDQKVTLLAEHVSVLSLKVEALWKAEFEAEKK